MKKIYILLSVIIAFAALTGRASAATITSPWYITPQTMGGDLLASYEGNTTDPFSIYSFTASGRVHDRHQAHIPFLKGQGIATAIYNTPNQYSTTTVDQFKTDTYDQNGKEVIDRYGLNIRKNFDTAYITLTGTSTDITEVLFLVMEIHNANGTVALQQYGTYFDSSQTGFAQMVIKANNLGPGQTLAIYPVFKGVTTNQTLANVTIRVDLYKRL